MSLLVTVAILICVGLLIFRLIDRLFGPDPMPRKTAVELVAIIVFIVILLAFVYGILPVPNGLRA